MLMLKQLMVRSTKFHILSGEQIVCFKKISILNASQTIISNTHLKYFTRVG